jgi:phosphopantothenoylcysteine decarboxylase/phosphopantothenate--cysteine ligase
MSPPSGSPGPESPGSGSPLAGKRVVLGVCGGIAAYKAVEVCRRLSDAGALVSPILTESATRFVGPLTFSALAAEPARTSLFSDEPAWGAGASGTLEAGASGTPEAGTAAGNLVPHVHLGRNADAIVVAPATARLIGCYAAGISSDLLSATLLATRAPVLVCPAMHTEMWEHPAVQDNIATLRRRGVHILEPAEGRLAGGDFGTGRLREPEEIVAALAAILAQPAAATARGALAGAATSAAPAEAEEGEAEGPFTGVRAVVSAGGTREPLDPVRYIGNRSSGKQGYAVASELRARGAQVTLVTSSDLAAPADVDVVEVETAAEMAGAVLDAAARADVVVMAAAVADYRPAAVAGTKIKKSPEPLAVELVPTLDILAELSARRRLGQVLVGFAAETATGAELAELGRHKLVSKGVDLIVANDVTARARSGFGQDSSDAVIVSVGSSAELGLADKRAVAAKLVDAIGDLLGTNGTLSQRKGTAR